MPESRERESLEAVTLSAALTAPTHGTSVAAAHHGSDTLTESLKHAPEHPQRSRTARVLFPFVLSTF